MKALLNPKNAVESTGGSFKEGNVLVNISEFRVHKAPEMTAREGQAEIPADQQPKPTLALVWEVTRLDENMEPIQDEDGETLSEVLVFGMGGKSLAQAHPGGADSPTADDEEIEDQGTEVGAAGPTIFLANKEFALNSKSGCMMLMNSLQKSGLKTEYLDRVWAPDHVGAVYHMKTWHDDNEANWMEGRDGKKRPIYYKVVDKIVRQPGAAKKDKAAGKGAKNEGKVAKNEESKGDSKAAKTNEAETIAKTVMLKLSEDKSGETLTRKALFGTVTRALQDSGVEQSKHVAVLTVVKNDAWLTANQAELDMTVTEEGGVVKSVTFG